MTEELISFETAKLAKEKGFKHNSKCYGGNGEILENIENHTNNIMQRFRYEAPTQSLLQKWLREKHNISVIILHLEKWTDDDNNTYCVFDFDLKDISNGVKHISKSHMIFKTHEEALEKGLQESLKLT